MLQKIVLSMLTLIMTLSLVGCNQTSIDLISDLDRSFNWESINQNESIVLEMNMGDEDILIDLSMTRYVNSKDMQMEAEVTINSISYNGIEINLKDGMYQLRPLKIYLDGYKVFINTEFIKDIQDIMGGLNDDSYFTTQYIALDMKSELTSSGLAMNQIAYIRAAVFDLLKGLDTNLPISKNGNTYTIDLDDYEIQDLFFGVILELAEGINGMTEKQVQEEKDQYEMNKDDTLSYIKGSKVDAEFVLEDDKATSNIDLQLNISEEITGHEKIDILFNMSTRADKVPCKEVQFPTDVTEYDILELVYGDLNQLPPSGMRLVEVKAEDILYVNGKKYVPAKSALAQAGLTLVYDGVTKRVCIAEYDKEVVDLMVINGVSYLTSNQMYRFGVEVVIVGE